MYTWIHVKTLVGDLVSAIDSIKYGRSYCDNTHYFFEILF